MFMLEEVHEDAATKRLDFVFPRWRIRRAATALLKLVAVMPSLSKQRIFGQTRSIAYDLGALKQALVLLRLKRARGAAAK
jgi:hypothetical protein